VLEASVCASVPLPTCCCSDEAGYKVFFRAVRATYLWLTACLTAYAAAGMPDSLSWDAVVAVGADASGGGAGPGRGRAHAEDRDGAGQPDARAGRQRAPAVRHGRAGCTGTAPPFLESHVPEPSLVLT